MRVRYRKSINLGGGVRINLSKSGVGYSWGTKGFRYTKKSTGGTRSTVSIPGTGVSWVNESGSDNRPSSHTNVQTNAVQTFDTQDIKNNVASEMVSDGLEGMLTAATKTLRTYKLISSFFWIMLVVGCRYPICWIASAAFGIYSIYFRKENIIKLEYSINDDLKSTIEERMNPLIKITQSKKVWRITQTSKVANSKYASGASSLIKRNKCRTSNKPFFPFTTTEKVASFKTKNETLLFLPDKLFIMQGSKIGALNYDDIQMNLYSKRFIETEKVPSDAVVVDHTWEYVNKSGGPDKRFQNNKQIPVCLYGEMSLKSACGLDTVIMFSRHDIT